MYKTPAEAVAVVESFRAIQLGDGDVVDTLLFPAMTSLPAVTEAARVTRLEVGAQDMHWLDQGASGIASDAATLTKPTRPLIEYFYLHWLTD
jgi:triosephosphate isomerase